MRRFIVTALLAEARPFIAYYNLKRVSQSGLELYSSDACTLLVTGMGRDNAMIRFAALCERYGVGEEDRVVNIGLCGADARYPIGSLLVANAIDDAQSGESFYPSMLLSHGQEEVRLTSVAKPQSESGYEAVEMEAFAIAKVAQVYRCSANLLVAKVVSDHFEPRIPTKEAVAGWISPYVAWVEQWYRSVEALQGGHGNGVDTRAFEQWAEQLSLTKAQQDKLRDAMQYARLQKRPLAHFAPAAELTGKKEKSRAFQRLLDALIG